MEYKGMFDKIAKAYRKDFCLGYVVGCAKTGLATDSTEFMREQLQSIIDVVEELVRAEKESANE